MQPMRLCILLDRQFEKTYENTQWGKAKQMQPMRLCILLGRQFEKTYDNTQIKNITHDHLDPLKDLSDCNLLNYNKFQLLKLCMLGCTIVQTYQCIFGEKNHFSAWVVQKSQFLEEMTLTQCNFQNLTE